MLALALAMFSAALAAADVICPRQRSMVVESSLVFSSDQYRGLPPSSPPCTFFVQSASGADLLVTVSTSSSFSLRQPMSTSDILIRSDHDVLVVDRKPKVYRLFSSPVLVEIPTSLSFQATIVITSTVTCSTNSFECSRLCEVPASKNCSSVCLPNSTVCDSIDNCSNDENGCKNNTGQLTPSQSSFRYHTILRSSQLMLVGFFVLNGAFIMFFLLLSLCSVNACFSRKLFREKSRASRMTFIKYLREASGGGSAPSGSNVALLNRRANLRAAERERQATSSVLSRITFAPSPALREVEPEVEDRSERVLKEEICSLPAFQPQIYIRRQSLPAVHNPKQALKWKRTSVAH
ncbi:hypothetical protein Q1695_002223 [Nippostrongylus brasiliensis]|nr:hypothetical protein Q1695_002223 [Nippostrongylus brasiliensis]